MDLVRRGCILFGLSVLTLSILLVVSPVQAAEYGNIGGKPARPRADNQRSQSIFIHELDPGQSVEDAIEVVNYTNETKTLLVYATDSIVSSGGAFGCAQKVDELKDVGNWIKLSKGEVTLRSGQTEIIPFTITAPSFRPQVGENNGCIVVQEKNAATQDIDQDGGSIAISFRTAIRVAVWIPGDIQKSLRILGYAAERADDNSFTLKPRVKNDGNVSIDTEIQTVTSGILGDSKDVQTQQYPILRNATSDWAIPYKPSFWGGWYKSHFTATYDSNVANGIGDTTNKNLVTLQSETIYFFVPPHPGALLLEIFLLIIIGFGLFRLWLFWKRRKKTVEEWEVIIIDSQTDIVTLAERFGVSWKLMAKVNKLRAPYILRPGDAIRVPAQIANAAGSATSNDLKIITIDKPTDITAVAREHGVAWKQLAKLNKLKEPYILRPGDMIKIPVGSIGKLDKIKKIAKRKVQQRMEPVIVDKHTDIVTFAELYGLEWRELAKINKLKAPYILKPGYVVMVPAGSSPNPPITQQPVEVTADVSQPVSAAAAVVASDPAPVATVPSIEPIEQSRVASPSDSESSQPSAGSVVVSAEPVVIPEPAGALPQAETPNVAAIEPAPAAPTAPVVAPQPSESEFTTAVIPAPETVVPTPVTVEPPSVAETPEPVVYTPTTPEPPVVDVPEPEPKPEPTREPVIYRPKVVKIQDVKKVSYPKHVGQHGRTHPGIHTEENRPKDHPPD